MIGYNGIAFAQINSNKDVKFTKTQILLTVTAEVPVDDKEKWLYSLITTLLYFKLL